MSSVRFGPFSLDVGGRRLEREGVEIRLQPRVFDTLRYLVDNPGRVIRRDEFLDEVWPDTFVGDAALTRCIREIRRALDDRPGSPRFVATIPSVGYRFDAPVEAVDEPPGDPMAESETAQVRVLAVLPFRPLSEEKRDAALELGMADALINRLSGLRDLVVRPLATVRGYTELDQDPLAAGRALGVDAVLEGSLQHLGERIRVSVRVLRCGDGRALLAEHHDEEFGDVFRLQDAVCRQIADALPLRLDGSEARRIVRHGTDDVQAYRHFLRGRLGLGRMVPDEARRSIEHFEQALEVDPGYAEALASIAEAHILLAWQGIDSARHYERARHAARRALDLEPGLGGAWATLATVAWEHDRDWVEADRAFDRAVELAPNVVDVWGRYSASCAFSLRHDKAVRLGRRALEVDRTSAMAGAWLAQALHMSGRSAEAIEVGESVVARTPDAPYARFVLGLACAHSGRLREAIDHLELAAATGRPDFLGVLAYAHLKAGSSEAPRLEEQVRAMRDSADAPPVAMAMVHAAKGEADEFFAAMEEAFEQPGLHAALIAAEPLFEPFRSDPRAQRLIRRLRLPEPT